MTCLATGRELTKDNKTTGLYAQTCCQVAEECGTKSVDLYSEMMKSEVSFYYSRCKLESLSAYVELNKYGYSTELPTTPPLVEYSAFSVVF